VIELWKTGRFLFQVYRVAAVYVVAGGFIIQIASVAFPAWDLPVWSLRLLISLVLAGFLLALSSPRGGLTRNRAHRLLPLCSSFPGSPEQEASAF
jgi:hypothetical protein